MSAGATIGVCVGNTEKQLEKVLIALLIRDILQSLCKWFV
jgi:hypothetical protein